MDLRENHKPETIVTIGSEIYSYYEFVPDADATWYRTVSADPEAHVACGPDCVCGEAHFHDCGGGACDCQCQWCVEDRVSWFVHKADGHTDQCVHAHLGETSHDWSTSA